MKYLHENKIEVGIVPI